MFHVIATWNSKLQAKKIKMRQTTNAIVMIWPVSFRMNVLTSVNNYYQKVLNGLLPSTVNAKAQQEFDVFVEKLRAVGVDVTVVDDNLNTDTRIVFFQTIGFRSMKTEM